MRRHQSGCRPRQPTNTRAVSKRFTLNTNPMYQVFGPGMTQSKSKDWLTKDPYEAQVILEQRGSITTGHDSIIALRGT